MRMSIVVRGLLMLSLFMGVAAKAAAPSTNADAWLKRYDEVMSPAFFESEARMTAVREDGTSRTYVMRIEKAGFDKLRASFLEPASARGQEMLRNDENLWLYMPNLKRAVRVASRDSFMGGDFNNADVLRVNYQADYSVALADAQPSGDTVLLVLRAKRTSAAYDEIRLWMTNTDPKQAQPVKAEYVAKSGKVLRTAEFLDVKNFGALVRPARIVMKNALTPKRQSTMEWTRVSIKDAIPAQRFVVDDLGH